MQATIEGNELVIRISMNAPRPVTIGVNAYISK